MTMIPAKMPKLVKKIFPNYVWDFFSEARTSSEKILYLTFDDGPVPEATEFVLNELKKYNAKATFFCIGDNVQKHATIFNKVIEEGHAIGNHTQHHLEGWKTDTKDYIQNILEAETFIKEHNTQKLFRPPYGRIKKIQGKQLRTLGYHIIMWDVVAKDWRKDVSEEDCLKNILNHTVSGSIIVLHDSLKALKNVKYVLPKVLEYYSNAGFRFEKIAI